VERHSSAAAALSIRHNRKVRNWIGIGHVRFQGSEAGHVKRYGQLTTRAGG
jgi:hypothetical protein